MKAEDKKTGSVFREYFELIVETAVFVFFVMTFVIQAFQIPTGSMEPNLLIGDFLLVNKLIYANSDSALDRLVLPKRAVRSQEIIVFKYPEDLTKDYVKRAIGLPGDVVEIKQKQVYVNQKPLEEPYKYHGDSRVYEDSLEAGFLRDNYGPVTVPAGQIFALGDNRDDSLDSRYWGFVPISYVRGRPWIIYFSYKAEPDAYLKTSFEERMKKLVRFLPKARLNRILKVIH